MILGMENGTKLQTRGGVEGPTSGNGHIWRRAMEGMGGIRGQMAQGASVKGQVWEGGEGQQRGPLRSQVVPVGDSGFGGGR